MKQFKRCIPFFLVVLSALSSCLDKDDEPRTWELEMQELNRYITNLLNLGYDVDTTELGVYYIVKEEGEGPFPEQGDTLTIAYAGYFIDGTMFENTTIDNSEGTITFNFIDDTMIPGFEDGLKVMNKGSNIEMVIPSDLAYGAEGTYLIPPYTSLIFVTGMIDLKPVSDND